MAMSLLPCCRHGADRRLPHGKEEAMFASFAFMLALVLLLMVIDRMRE
jgi:hypothetical protein